MFGSKKEQSHPVTASHNETVSSEKDSDHHNIQSKGWIVGGKYRTELSSENVPDFDPSQLQEVEIDLPLTAIKPTNYEGKDFVVLEFVEGDKENPFNWNPKRKMFISLQLCAMTLFIGLATTAYSVGISNMAVDIHTSVELGEIGLFTFNFVCAMGPLFLAPFCELAGRRVVYVGAFGCFALMFIALALGKNIGTMIVCRALLGLFGCVGTILVGGTFGDMYIPADRAQPMAFFSFIAIFGTVAAPIYAGFVVQSIGWRWLEGIQGMANIPLFICILFFLPETRGSVCLSKRAKALRNHTGNDCYVDVNELEAPGIKEMLHNSSVKAVKMLATEPVVFALGIWISFAWFLTFLFLSVIHITFVEKKGWGMGVGGLPYIALCLGTTIGWLANMFQIKKYESIVNDPNRKVTPEDRLYGAMCGAIFLPIGLFIYSFTQYKQIHWMGPMVGLTCITIGIFFIFESVYSYTSDCYGENASSAIAGQGAMRNTLGSVSPLFATQMFHNMGSQWAGLLLSCIAALLTLIPYVLFKWGPTLRSRSKLASLIVDGN